jgi:hypothetical protein
MKSLMHRTHVRHKLRRFRPLWESLFLRRIDLSGEPTPRERILRMNGRGVFLFSFGRCGTTVFADFLATHPQVTTFGEVLNEESYYSFFRPFSRGLLRRHRVRPSLVEADFYRFAERLVRKAPNHHCLLDMKIESLHLIEGNWRIPGQDFKIFDALLESGAPVILLERRDLVARHVSGQLAQRRRKYHSYHTGTVVEPFAIDVKKMEADNAIIRTQTELIRSRFVDHPRFETLVYEDLFEPNEAGTATRFASGLSERMADFLGLTDMFDNTPQLQRISSKEDAALITNVDEVNAARIRLLGSQGA